MTINDFAMLEPMKYYDNPEPKTATLRQKRQDILDNKNNAYIATVKHDGDWGMFIHYSKGHNLIRSRSISKVTGVYGDYTAKLPTAIEVMDKWPDNTVILAEICVDGEGVNANTIGTILRCLPEKAVERQKTTRVKFWGFDLLMINGFDFTDKPYVERIYTLEALLNNEHGESKQCLGAPHFRCTTVFADGYDFAETADEIIQAGGEGLVIQRKDNGYWPGTRTAWKTLKLKQRLPEMELLVIDALEPTQEYTGKEIETWPFWLAYPSDGDYPTMHIFDSGREEALAYENDFNTNGMKRYGYTVKVKPVTKPYFFGWKSAIRVLYNNVEVDVASGLTDEDREWLATKEARDMIQSKALYAVVRGMSTNDKGAIRHPVFVRFRYPEEY